MRNAIRIIAIILLASIAIYCGYEIYTESKEDNVQITEFEEIAETIKVNGDEVDENKYKDLYEQNNDFVGWIRIDDTPINYPVMQNKDNPEYYLKHNFKKEYSRLGVPFVQANCDIETDDNIIIYGHNMKNKTMFNALTQYSDREFYNNHKLIRFDTLNESNLYEVIAVFKTKAYSDNGFRYYDFTKANTKDEFNAYIEKCKALSFYETSLTAEYGDRLLTLSTCEYTQNNGRFVVIAKQI